MVKKKSRLGNNPLDWIKSTVTEEPGEKNRESKGQAECSSTGEEFELMYFQDYWAEPGKGSPGLTLPSLDKDNMIIFDTEEAIFQVLKKHLPGWRIALVQPGKKFHEKDSGIYEMVPGNPDHYNRLLERLRHQDLVPDNVLYLWSKQNFSASGENIKSQLETGIYPVFFLTRAFMEQRTGEGIRLLYLYIAPGGEVRPLDAAISGFARTLRLENPGFIYKTVELRIPAHQQTGTDTLLQEAVDEVLIELAAEDGEVEILLEGKKRYTRRFQPLVNRDRQEKSSPWKDRGIYLITGGTGGLGMIMARYLAQKFRARLILTGRSALDPRKAAMIKEVEALGAEVVYRQADAARRQDVEALAKNIKQRFGNLNGIIHSAGVIRDAFILKKTQQQMEEVLAAKIYGTLNLDEVFKEEKIDVFLLFSSFSAVLGNTGQGDYAYANRFMDYYARQRESLRQAGQRWGRSAAVNWPLWQEGGMKVSNQERESSSRQTGLRDLPTAKGLEALEYIFCYLPHIASCQVFYGSRERILEEACSGFIKEKPLAAPAGKAVGLTPLNVDPKVLFARAETYLKNILAEILKLPAHQIDSTTRFEKYGIDSIIIKMFNNRIEKELFPINKTLLFEYQVLEELTRYFVKHHAQQLATFFQLDREPPSAESKGLPPGADDENRWRKLVPLREKYLQAGRKASSYNLAAAFPREDIAIIGIAGCYPRARTLHEYWENLKQGRDCISEIPDSRWNYLDYYDPDPGKGMIYTKWGGFIDGVDQFDPFLFNISPREAKTMDPQDRLFLETVWALLEDAGYSRKELNQNTREKDTPVVGVFVGVTSYLYHLLGSGINQALSLPQPWSLANRVSFIFNFHGPSMPVDTACSSSLTALHLACESLKRGECRLAVAGGVNLYLHPAKYMGMCHMRMLSATGRCHTFGANSDGFIPGEGVGAVLLKPLAAALRDNDHIYALIKGSSINHGGRTNGYTVPNPVAQASLILQALKNTNIHPRTIGCIEAHGTGTILGDPIEIEGLTRAFRKYTRENQFCPISSVKSNIGHLEAAAGIAGITKLVLQLKHRQLVPSLLAEQLNPNIDFEHSPFYVQRELTEWKPAVIIEQGIKKRYPRRAGISSFGAGGTNVHVILEEYEQEPGNTNTHYVSPVGPPGESLYPAGSCLVVLSARDRQRLEEYASLLAEFLERKKPGMPGAKSLEEIEKDLVTIAAGILEVEQSDIETREDLAALGFDPVSSARIAHQINKSFGFDFTPVFISRFQSLNALAAHVQEEYKKHVKAAPSTPPAGIELRLVDIAYTLQLGREPMDERIAVICSSVEELCEKLDAYVRNSPGNHIEDIYTGNARANKSIPVSLFKGKAGEEHIRILLEDRKLEQLAQLWVLGVEIDWHQWYTHPLPRRVSLPTYPFARERCWLDESRGIYHEKQSFLQPLHPLIDGIHPGLSMGQGLVFQKKLRQNETIIKNHQVKGSLILPGVGYLEMARAAFSHSCSANHFNMCRVLWLQPLKVLGKAKEVRVIIKSNNNKGFEFEIQGNDEPGNRFIIHARGEFSLNPAGQEGSSGQQRYCLQEIESRCTRRVEKQEVYDWYDRVGVTYGPYFRTLEYIHVNDSSREALGVLCLSPGLERELANYTLHPALMDGALQTIMGLAVQFPGHQPGDITPMLPFAVGKVEILHPLKERVYAYVKPSAGEKPGTREMNAYDAVVLDETGLVCIKCQEITFRPLKQVQPDTASPGDRNLENFYYRPVWVKVPMPVPDPPDLPTPGKSVVLIVYTDSGRSLETALAHKHLHRQDIVIRLRLGATTQLEPGENWQVEMKNPRALLQVAAQLKEVDCIYFLGGITSSKIDMCQPGILEELEESQHKGVLSLYRLIKALNSRGFSQKPLQLKVVTNDVHAVIPGEISNPFAGSLHGLTLSAAKEYPRWQVTCLDISLKEKETGETKETGGHLEAVAAAIMQEPGSQSGELVVLRAGRRYVQRLEPIKLPEVTRSPFKHRGVYLILGGIGGIGLELSRYLAETVKARLVLIDRSPLTDRQKKMIARIENQGGEVLYLQADASQPEDMKTVLDTAVNRFGSINGVIHSAIVLRDRSLDKMDEETFCAALDPKVRGSVVLFQVVREQSLDFIMFFSAAQSFVCNAGQSNYAAGCTFKDALAAYLSQKTTYPVKVINWGYWGTVGIVASEFYQERLASRGIYSITPQEGIEAVKRALSHRVSRLVPLKAEGPIMKKLLVEKHYQVELYPGRIPSIFSTALGPLRLPPGESLGTRLEEGYRKLSQYSRLLLLGVFQQMGVFRQASQVYDKDNLAQLLGIIPVYKRLYDTLLEILVRAGMLEWQEDRQKVKTLDPVEAPGTRHSLETLEKLKTQLTEQYPDLAAHVRLLAVCLAAYPALLRGETPAQDVMFPNSGMELVEGIYKGNARADYFNRLTAQIAQAYVRERCPHLDPREKITIVEIGAGTGGTCAFVLDALQEYNHRLSYIYTDISPGFTRYGKRHFHEVNPFMEFGRLDIETGIEQQGYQPGSADLVIAANVVHATRDIRETLRNIKQLLKTHGWLILNEVTEQHDFATLTFGLLAGWWLYEDEEERLKDSPLLSSGMWVRILEEEGFTRVKSLGDKPAGTAGFVPSNHVITAESNGEVRKLFPARWASTEIDRLHQEPEVSSPLTPPAPVPAVVQGQNQREIQYRDINQAVEQAVVDSLASVLQINSREFDKDTTYMDFGVDSILAVEIINLVNTRLGIQLRTTDLFNFPTLRALTDHIVTEFGNDIQWQDNRPGPSAKEIFLENSSDSCGAAPGDFYHDPLLAILNRMKNGELDIDEAHDLLEVYDEV